MSRDWGRLSRRAFLGLLPVLLALLPGLSWAHRGPAEPETIRIGSWNIEWLGQPGRRENRLAQAPDDLARYLIHSGCDAVGLMEISWNTDTTEGPGNDTLVEALRLVKERTDQEWRHVLFPREGSADRDQLCGVAWNASRLRRQDGPWPIPIYRIEGQPEAWRRPPYAVQFSAGPDANSFVLIVVHLKSNRGGPEATAPIRDAETLSLVHALGAVKQRFRDEDIVVLGDFNCLKHTERALSRLSHAGFRHLNEEDQLTWIASRDFPAAPFDRIFVPEQRPAFADAKQTTLKTHHLGDEAAFRARLSDHYLIYTDIKVLRR